MQTSSACSSHCPPAEWTAKDLGGGAYGKMLKVCRLRGLGEMTRGYGRGRSEKRGRANPKEMQHLSRQQFNLLSVSIPPCVHSAF